MRCGYNCKNQLKYKPATARKSLPRIGSGEVGLKIAKTKFVLALVQAFLGIEIKMVKLSILDITYKIRSGAEESSTKFEV